jgi:hypothetical protein
MSTEFYVTIMNGDLERSFYGNHIFIMQDGRLIDEPVGDVSEQQQLRKAIADSLIEHLTMLNAYNE